MSYRTKFSIRPVNKTLHRLLEEEVHEEEIGGLYNGKLYGFANGLCFHNIHMIYVFKPCMGSMFYVICFTKIDY